MKTQVIHGTAVSILLAIGIGLNLELMPVRRSQFSPSADEISFTWNPVLYRMMSFGHVPLATDWLLIKFLTVPDWKHVTVGKRAKSYYDLELATELDPAFYSLYTAGAHFLTVVRNDNEGAIKIIEKGENFRQTKLASYPAKFRETHWGAAWRIPFIKAFIEMFELNDFPAAAKSLSVIDQFPEAPAYLTKLSARLLDPVQRYDVGERILNVMLVNSKQDKEREILKNRIDDLKTSRLITKVNLRFEEFLRKKFGAKMNLATFSRDAADKELLEFSKKSKVPLVDDRGGKLYIILSNRIDTTTKREKVFGLE